MTIRTPGDTDSFERYYLKNVAQSEGCGCAEGVLRKTRPIKFGDSLSEIAVALKKRFGRSKVSD
ncbi:hypothetical protein [Pelagibius sp. Alg239-R121]|uniref:hypothetical protein n=1 Tax=Pelagibius sp. Alg239-R121 TaxID=2993448 RepID=UPI0024A6B69C|nr:hypothetical protein [Pelagibius sp. Alg239-R121]